MEVQAVNQANLSFTGVNSFEFQKYIDHYKNLYDISLTVDEIKFCVEESIAFALFDIWHHRYKSLLPPAFVWDDTKLDMYINAKDDDVKSFDLALLDNDRINYIKTVLFKKLQELVERKSVFQNSMATFYKIVTGTISKILPKGDIIVNLDVNMQTRIVKVNSFFPLVYQPLPERKFYQNNMKLHFYIHKLIFSNDTAYIILNRINKKIVENLLNILTVKEQEFFMKRWRVKPAIKCIYRDAGKNSVIGTNFFIPKDKLQILSNLLFSEIIRVKNIV